MEQIQGMSRFLAQNSLLTTSDMQATKNLMQQFKNGKTSLWQWLLHHYLFFKIPLFRPDKFLQALLPWVGFIYNRLFFAVLGVIGASGLYLTARQWDAFEATFDYFFTAQGMFWYLAALLFIKTVHELGHAITACRFGCRIPTIGVAFMVGFPILYTDTSEAWKLNSRRSRLAIGVAGVSAELIIALLATLLWNFMPEGAGQSSVVMLATITWITSLAINLNPMMRFDGYYILADYLGMDNLQERAFALARWQLREWLLGLNNSPPEHFTPRRRWTLLIYSYATWIYRLLLFLGIALLVYHLLFKLAGIFLMIVELLWFIALPIFRELREWWVKKAELHWNYKSIATLISMVGLSLFMVVPWQDHIEAPALLTARHHVKLYPPTPSRLLHVAVTRGQSVKSGDLLITLESPDLKQKIILINSRIKALQWKITHASSRRSLLENSSVMQKEMVALLTEREGLLLRTAKLRITAPFAAVVTDIKKSLLPGRWIASNEALLELIDSGPPQIQAFVEESDIKRVSADSSGMFQPNDLKQPTIQYRMTGTEPMAVQYLEKPYFASIFGGPIRVWEESPGRFIPYTSIYRLTLDTTDKAKNIHYEQPGIVQLQAERESILRRIWRQVGQILIRESGF